MQDDLAWVALTMEVGSIIRAMAVTAMAAYGIEVSVEKRMEDEAVVDGPQPNPAVLFIGGLFDTLDLDDLLISCIRLLLRSRKEPRAVAG
jgi:hypothetical protein